MTSSEDNWVKFFLWPKDTIESGCWSESSPIARASFPVIAAFRGSDGWSFPGIKKIAEFTGLTEREVRHAIAELRDLDLIETAYKKNPYGQMQLHFFIDCPDPDNPDDKRRHFDFKNGLARSEIWARMSLECKALYPVLRCYSYFHLALYYEIEGIEADLWDEDSMRDAFKMRKYDLFDLNMTEFIDKCGFQDGQELHKAIADLQKHKLVDNVMCDGQLFFRVYKIPYDI